MADLYHKAEKHLKEELPFVIYSKPNESKIIGLFQKDNVLNSTENFIEKGFVFVSFDGKIKALIPENSSDVIIKDFQKIEVNQENPSFEINETDKLNFEDLVQKGIDSIHLAKFKKVVLSRKEEVVLKNNDVISLFKKLVSQYPTAFKYCFYHPKVGLWLGATPEQLLKVEDLNLKTVALAGTQTYKEGEIVWENKERKEQEFVTEFILENIKPYVSDEILSDPYTFKAGNIVHIKTDISAKLNKIEDLKAVLETLHPTPAVCGLPKAESRDFILKNENYDREFYSGFLGELNVDFANNKIQNSDLFVNLRCMKLENNVANLFIGCGITKDSIPENEYIETVNKSMTLKKIIL